MRQWEASSSPPEIPVVPHDAALTELTPTALQAYLYQTDKHTPLIYYYEGDSFLNDIDYKPMI